MNDNRKLLDELMLNIRSLIPEVNEVSLSLRIEQVLSGYSSTNNSIEVIRDDLSDNIKLYISSKRLEGLSELTLEDYYRELSIFDFRIAKSTVRITTNDIRNYLSNDDTIMSSTRGKKLSVIKSFFTWLVDEEIILKNPAAKINQVKQPKRLPKALTAVELEVIREACESDRDTALVEVLYSTGCRLSEVSNMLIENIDWSSNSITVVGKGNKERVVYFNHKAVHNIKTYLGNRADDNECSYLFSTIRRPYRKMKNKTIQDSIDKIARRTGIDKNVTPHVFRHTMATLAMENGIELGDLQQLLGHSNPGTTLRYAEVSEGRKKNAHNKFVR